VNAPRSLEVRRVIEETRDAVSLVFAVPEDDPEPWQYRPGQFLTVRIPSDRTGSVARCYSLASSPLTGDELRVTVKRTAGGYGSNWLCDNVEAGSRLDVLPPTGRFTPTSLDDDLLLFAGGSGVTPVFSILSSALAAGSGRVTLFYANRDDHSVIFARELAALAAAHADRFEVVHWLESVQGRPGRAELASFTRSRPGRACYVCGPGAFMDTVQAALGDAGVARGNVHLEVFSSLTGDPFAQIDLSEGDSEAVTTPVEVEIEGRTLLLNWPADVTMVDLLLRQGVEVPYLCRDGECGTCQATLERGAVRMETHKALDPADIADGYVLTCQARPDGDGPIRIVF
jgi:3-ketosteroid 9alpha-monooxygenase subunit B